MGARIRFVSLAATVIVVASCGAEQQAAPAGPGVTPAPAATIATGTVATSVTVAPTISSNAPESLAEQIVGTRFALGDFGPIREIGSVAVPEGSELISEGTLGNDYDSIALVYRTGGLTGLILVVGQPRGEGAGPYSYEVEFATGVQFSGPNAVEPFGSDCERKGGDRLSETIVATVSPETDRTIQAWRVSSKAPYVEKLDAESVTCLAGNIEGPFNPDTTPIST